jgi:hypothetical protein
METIVLASESDDVLDRMEKQVPVALRRSTLLRRISPGPGFLEFLRYEIPDLVILQASRPEELLPVFQGLEEDPWLDSVGVVLVTPDADDAVELFQGYNIAFFLPERDLDRNLGRVVRILDEKRAFLNYDSIIKKITALSGEVMLETDLLLANYYAALFSNYLFKEGHVDRGRQFGVRLTLAELIINAMEHGSAGITYDEKTKLQAEGRTVQDLIEERAGQVPWQGRRVTLAYHIGAETSRFVITDEGDGFDVSLLGGAGELAHGRGIALARASAGSLTYHGKGNEVSVEFTHNGSAERVVPPGFIEAEPRHLAPGDVVFWENTQGDHLYYIVSGEYDVFVGGTLIARLTSSDVFMGEMSFLLGNRRTATVITAMPGKLVEISRQTFTDAVKRYPNYGIFLSKMLARRLRDNNRRFAG